MLKEKLVVYRGTIEEDGENFTTWKFSNESLKDKELISNWSLLPERKKIVINKGFDTLQDLMNILELVFFEDINFVEFSCREAAVFYYELSILSEKPSSLIEHDA